jgi:hypothetical protein
MKQTDPVLHISQQQAALLIDYCKSYRAYLWQQVIPTTERNTTLRAIQEVQSRLVEKQEEQATVFQLTPVELASLKQLCTDLLHYYGHSTLPDKTKKLQELAGLHIFLNRSAKRHTQAL